MDKNDVLDAIFQHDPLGILALKPNHSHVQSTDDRLLASFQEINDFVESNGKEPEPNPANISEFQLYARLKSLRNDDEKSAMLIAYDVHNLLPAVASGESHPLETHQGLPKVFNSIDDILEDDSLAILESDTESLFDFKHTPKDVDRAKADFVARRKPCRDFDTYKLTFQEVQADLASGKRSLIEFNERQLRVGNFFIHHGVLLFLEKINEANKDKFGKIDGRTRIIFENGTESKMKLRSLGKNLFTNGKAVTSNIDEENKAFSANFSNITDNDKEAGYIYILQSKSKDEHISSIQNLYKIGYSTVAVEERIKHAEKEPTYLMAPVSIQGVWQCFNMNPQKFEKLLHQFFGQSCLELDVFDSKGKRHTPREWFIVPLDVIEQAIELMMCGEIVKYRFDTEKMMILYLHSAPRFMSFSN